VKLNVVILCWPSTVVILLLLVVAAVVQSSSLRRRRPHQGFHFWSCVFDSWRRGERLQEPHRYSSSRFSTLSLMTVSIWLCLPFKTDDMKSVDLVSSGTPIQSVKAIDSASFDTVWVQSLGTLEYKKIFSEVKPFFNILHQVENHCFDTVGLRCTKCVVLTAPRSISNDVTEHWAKASSTDTDDTVRRLLTCCISGIRSHCPNDLQCSFRSATWHFSQHSNFHTSLKELLARYSCRGNLLYNLTVLTSISFGRWCYCCGSSVIESVLFVIYTSVLWNSAIRDGCGFAVCRDHMADRMDDTMGDVVSV